MSHRPPMQAFEKFFYRIERTWPHLNDFIAKAHETADALDAPGKLPSSAWATVLLMNLLAAQGYIPAAAVRKDGSVNTSALPASFSNMIHLAISEGAVPDIDTAMLFDAWPRWKVAYRFDVDLAAEIMASDWSDRIPCSDLMRLPADCFFVEAPIEVARGRDEESMASAGKDGRNVIARGERVTCKGFFAYTTELDIQRNGNQESVRELFFHFIDASGRLVNVFSLSLDLPSIEVAIDEEMAFNADAFRENAVMDARTGEIVKRGRMLPCEAIDAYSTSLACAAKQCCSLLLYLSNCPADTVRGLPTGAQRRAPRSQHVGKADTFVVGSKIGSAIRAWRASGAGSIGGAKVAPHVRRGHFHHYWVGRGEDRARVLRWLHPMLVNGAVGELATVVHDVVD